MFWGAHNAINVIIGVLPRIPAIPGDTWWTELLGRGLSLAYGIFWIWMLWHCARTEPDRQFWLWLLILVPGVGPVVYFVTRYLPSTEIRGPAMLRRWTRGRDLTRLETAAIQIGNPHQFLLWGDALRDVGLLDQAATAYERALAKEPKNLPALWGAAQVAASQKRPADVRSLTQRILEKDPQYKFGDVSLACGKSLIDLGETVAATQHLEQHVHRWRHPEAVYLLASLHAQQGNAQAARKHLQALVHDINGSPTAIARRCGRWKSRAQQLLKKLPANVPS